MKWVFPALMLLVTAPAGAQIPSVVFLDDSPAATIRTGHLLGGAGTSDLLWRQSGGRADSLAAPMLWVRSGTMYGDGVAPAPARLRTELNTGYPIDRNNGSLWGGLGLNTLLSGGAAVRFGPYFSAQIAPDLTYQQNRGYPLRTPPPAADYPFANGLYGQIDLPQRFGEDAYWSLAPGASWARVDAGHVGLGISTENLWWGPGLRESITLSSSAGGFPHVFIGIPRPVDIGIGRLGLEMFWGQLRESEFFDTIPSNDLRLLTGFGVTLAPGAGLTLGFVRLYTFPWEISASRLFPFFEAPLKSRLSTPDNPQGNEPFDDQRLSVFFQWVLPASGFEVYGEYGREDHAWDFEDLVQEFDHSAAFLIGLQKVHPLSASRWLRIHGEWTNLQQTRDHRPGVRGTNTFYVHRPQGHTYRGQILGAGIGPGAEAQYLGIDLLSREGSWGGFAERVRRNEMSAAAIAARSVWPPQHDVELTIGGRGFRQIGRWSIAGQLGYSYRYNRDFVADESNWRGVLQAGWAP